MARFVIIDDYPDVARILAAVVETLGHEALALTSGVGAVERAQEYKANVVITDIQMAPLDGLEVARLFRANLPDVLLVGISGRVNIHQHPDVVLFDSYFQKPLRFEELERVANIADARHYARCGRARVRPQEWRPPSFADAALRDDQPAARYSPRRSAARDSSTQAGSMSRELDLLQRMAGVDPRIEPYGSRKPDVSVKAGRS